MHRRPGLRFIEVVNHPPGRGDFGRYSIEIYPLPCVMKLYGVDTLLAAFESDGFLLKMILNESAACLFPHTSEHSDAMQPGLCYKHDSQGNALAAMVKPNPIEIRHHNAFSENRVRHVLGLLLSAVDSDDLRGFAVQYQGRLLAL